MCQSQFALIIIKIPIIIKGQYQENSIISKYRINTQDLFVYVHPRLDESKWEELISVL